MESDIVFDPFQLDCDVTPEKILQASINKEHTKALVMSLRINELDLVCQVMEEVKPGDSKCHIFLFYLFDKNTIVFMNLTWPSNTGLELPDQNKIHILSLGWNELENL